MLTESPPNSYWTPVVGSTAAYSDIYHSSATTFMSKLDNNEILPSPIPLD